MTKAEDKAREEAISKDALADVIFKFIEKLPHAKRLYPDLYALDLAEKIRIAGHERGSSRADD